METRKRLIVNQDLCIACGLCSSICPEVFEQDPDTYKSWVKENVGESAGEPECTQEAIDSCPVGAISWAPGVPR
jgi:ferredoxin